MTAVPAAAQVADPALCAALKPFLQAVDRATLALKLLGVPALTLHWLWVGYRILRGVFEQNADIFAENKKWIAAGFLGAFLIFSGDVITALVRFIVGGSLTC
ncbi:MAG: hypothetical protein QXQ87_04665 [Halobacteria archaeon]